MGGGNKRYFLRDGGPNYTGFWEDIEPSLICFTLQTHCFLRASARQRPNLGQIAHCLITVKWVGKGQSSDLQVDASRFDTRARQRRLNQKPRPNFALFNPSVYNLGERWETCVREFRE